MVRVYFALPDVWARVREAGHDYQSPVKTEASNVKKEEDAEDGRGERAPVFKREPGTSPGPHEVAARELGQRRVRVLRRCREF